MIFLSDGEGQVSDSDIQDLCSTAVRLGCVIFLLVEAGYRHVSKNAFITPYRLLWSRRFIAYAPQDGRTGP
jgi:hypothetical protein